MHIFHSFDSFAAKRADVLWARPVVTVGTFDGLHLGHQFLVNELIQWAGGASCPAVVVTFETHPRTVIERADSRRILPAPQKLELLRRMGVDAALLITFDETLRALTAREFARHILAGVLTAQGVLLGHNNAVGRGREGTIEVLAALGREYGFEARQSAKVEIDGEAISSSAIRSHISRGDFLWARKMLGRPYTIRGTVAGGKKLGRTIGFPTINLSLAGLVHPPVGVYGVRVTLGAGERGGREPGTRHLLGAANIGVRPTVETGSTEPLLEVHLLDYDGDCYGEEAEVEFVFRVRDEQKFAGVEALKAQLAADTALVRERFTHGAPKP
jgi:riboflavin kinase/FMN adenylyltransferase